jgi:hypothetical protein
MLMTAIPPLGDLGECDAGLLWFCKRALPKHPFEQLRHQLAISRSTAMWNELA